ncbi:MAG: hypothetical protein SWH78_17480 [Thermodesulfobacteriota bacterium]|nr:hypothetical protein [Thermodesulfobacteriota bacterium]
MEWYKDIHNRKLRMSDERREHVETDHPEMWGQMDRVREALLDPDIVVRSRADLNVELYYRHYENTPVTEKYLCVVVKAGNSDLFVITAYFTDTVKRGEVLWEKK